MTETKSSVARLDSKAIATAFVDARLNASPIANYPGGVRPQSLAEAYALQDRAIARWPGEIGGWKVGRIVGDAAREFGVDRLAGPIFHNSIVIAQQTPAPAYAFAGGFAAIEGEAVIITRSDVRPGKMQWSTEEAKAQIEKICAGVEIASSPYAAINDDGPLVTISDFGNNSGLIIGDEIPDWRDYKLEDWSCETFIDGARVGKNSAAAIPGGPIESLRFLLENLSQRGLMLKAGSAISTGAITGVHGIGIGQTAGVKFEGLEEITCVVKPAEPLPAGQQQKAASS